MAKATKKVIATSITLELDLLEATVLLNLLSKIGGSPLTSGRNITEGIYESLTKLDLPSISREITKVHHDSLFYNDNSLDIINEAVDKHGLC